MEQGDSLAEIGIVKLSSPSLASLTTSLSQPHSSGKQLSHFCHVTGAAILQAAQTIPRQEGSLRIGCSLDFSSLDITFYVNGQAMVLPTTHQLPQDQSEDILFYPLACIIPSGEGMMTIDLDPPSPPVGCISIAAASVLLDTVPVSQHRDMALSRITHQGLLLLEPLIWQAACAADLILSIDRNDGSMACSTTNNCQQSPFFSDIVDVQRTTAAVPLLCEHRVATMESLMESDGVAEYVTACLDTVVACCRGSNTKAVVLANHFFHTPMLLHAMQTEQLPPATRASYFQLFLVMNEAALRVLPLQLISLDAEIDIDACWTIERECLSQPVNDTTAACTFLRRHRLTAFMQQGYLRCSV